METLIYTDEKAYERWRSSIDKLEAKPEKTRFLLLPLKDSNSDSCSACTNRTNIRVLMLTTQVSYDNYPFVLNDAIDSYK